MGHCGSLWVIVGHCWSLRVIAGHCGSLGGHWGVIGGSLCGMVLPTDNLFRAAVLFENMKHFFQF